MVRALVKTSSEQGLTQVNLTYLTPVNGVPGAGQFRSDINGRAPVVDLSNDLSLRMGIDRIQTQNIVRIDRESGPNGEPVYKPLNDKFEQVRFVGSGWTNINGGSDAGVRPQTSVVNDYVEIIFVGTGLNILTVTDGNIRQLEASIDGGSYSDVTYPTSGAATIVSRKYASNTVVNAASGLSFGLHTAKVRLKVGAGSSALIYGFEILSESTNIRVISGTASVNGKQLTLSALHSSSYNSGFESGTLGTKGGRVLVYQKSDGSIGKAVTPTDASQLNLASANHANEEVVRIYHWREFGAGRTAADEFSTANSNFNNRAFTLDDGTTTLVLANVASAGSAASLNGREGLRLNNTASNFLIITFVGTGLDLSVDSLAGYGFSDIKVNGSSIGAYTRVSNFSGIQKIVSGLPYGTHVVRFETNGSLNTDHISQFLVYGPKKPTLPAGAVELGEYNIMANYVGNTTSGVDRIATGVLRKHVAVREAIYSGSWATPSLDVSIAPGGLSAISTASGAYMEYIFFGTGFEMRGESGAATLTGTAQLQSLSTGGALLSMTAANFPGLITQNYASGFTISSGAIGSTGGVAASGFQAYGLPLGLYRLRLTVTTAATSLRPTVLDIITPIHIHKNNGPAILQNTVSIGSQGVTDLRSLPYTFNKVGNSMQLTPVASQTMTAGTGFQVAHDWCGSFVSSGKPILITATIPSEKSAAASRSVLQLFVDGAAVTTDYKETYVASSNCDTVTTISRLIHTTPGVHHFMLRADPTVTGNLTLFSTSTPAVLIQEITNID